MTAPVFLFSLPRSGSTLLQRMLSCHSEISTHSELWFLLPHIEALRGKYSCSLYSVKALRNATNGLLEQLPGGEKDYFSALRLMTDDIYRKLPAGGEKYVLDKTPRYYFIIDEIAELYPDAKFIFLFRNPLSVAASLVESFNRNRLGDVYHRIDLFEGPGLLARGYERVRGRSLAVQYEKLVSDPEPELRSICEYLELAYMPEMIENFSDVPVGVMGDQFGSKQHTMVTAKSVEKWRRVFDTRYRQRFLLDFLARVGPDVVGVLGYSYDSLQNDVRAMETRSSLSLQDRYRELQCRLYSFFEVPLLKDKLRGRIPKNRRWYVHQ